MRILVDIDDVIFGWFHKAHAASVRAGLVPADWPLPTQWHCHVDYGVSEEKWISALLVATLDGSLYHGEPLPGAVAAMQSLKDAGHSIHIVTARGFFSNGDLVRKHTVDWLKQQEVPHDTLTFTKDKTLVNVDVAVDDSVRNVEALRAAGVETYLMDAPHNQDVVDFWRVEDMPHFADLLLGR